MREPFDAMSEEEIVRVLNRFDAEAHARHYAEREYAPGDGGRRRSVDEAGLNELHLSVEEPVDAEIDQIEYEHDEEFYVFARLCVDKFPTPCVFHHASELHSFLLFLLS